MSIGNARKFITRGLTDSRLRSSLNGATSQRNLYQVLDGENMYFTPDEFDEAYRVELTQCQFEEEAERRMEFKTWWDFLKALLPNPERSEFESCSQAVQCPSAGGCGGCY